MRSLLRFTKTNVRKDSQEIGENNMTKKKRTVERRKHKRFRMQEDAFVALKPHYEKTGHIIDISIDGLAFRYNDIGQPSSKSSELDIFFADDRFHLEKVPFETILDFETDSLMNFRRCGVQFGELTDNQTSRLNNFIKDYTIVRLPRPTRGR